jgi:hypothetical protein
MHESPATIYGDWNLDCRITNLELAQLQTAIRGGAATYDRNKDANCDGVLASGNNSPELLKFAANYAKQPPAACRGGELLLDGGGGMEESAMSLEGVDDGIDDSEPVDPSELAGWLIEELTPEDLAAFVAEATATAQEHADDGIGAEMMELLSYLE